MAEQQIKRPVGRPRKSPEERKQARADYMDLYYQANKEAMKRNAAKSCRKRQQILVAARAAGIQAN